MAGDWIKMRANLQTHPKVVRSASALNADRLRVIGGLHAVWCLFDEHSEGGQLCGYTPDAVDSLIGWPGFTQQLIAIGWVHWDGHDGLALPEFDTHNGASAKRRAQEADRKRVERAACKNDAQGVRKPSASEADKKRTREEKRRGINTPPPPVDTGGVDNHEDREHRKPRNRRPWRWAETWEGYLERGRQLGLVYSEASLGNAWTTDQEAAHKRNFRSQVEAADAQAVTAQDTLSRIAASAGTRRGSESQEVREAAT